jgi:hypothetical protein
MALGWDEGLVFVNACTWCCCDLDSHGVCMCCGRSHLTDRRLSALAIGPLPSKIEVPGASLLPTKVDDDARRRLPSRVPASSRS